MRVSDRPADVECVKESSPHYTRVYAMLMNLIQKNFLFPVFSTLHCLFLDHMYRRTSIRLVGKEY